MCLMGMLVDSYDSLLSLMSISWRGRERFANGTCLLVHPETALGSVSSIY